MAVLVFGTHSASAQSVTELQAMINQLMAQIAAMQSGGQESVVGTDREALKFSLSSGNPNAASIVANTEEVTPGVAVLEYKIEAESEGAEIAFEELFVKLTTSVASALVIDDVQIIINGETYDAENVPLPNSNVTTFRFDVDGDIYIGDREAVTVTVMVDLLAQESRPGVARYANGSTIKAEVSAIERDATKAEGADDIDDFKGVAIGGTHVLVVEGLVIPSDSFESESNTQGERDTTGIFSLEFDVTAVGGDFYIRDQATHGTAKSAGAGVIYTVEGIGVAAPSASLSSTANQDARGVDVVREGETETFTLTVYVNPSATGVYRVQLAGVYYTKNVNGVDRTVLSVPLPAEDFRTGYESINASGTTPVMSPSGSSITVRSGGSLQTEHGTWTFGRSGAGGGSVILLNGAQAAKGSAVELHVKAGGVFARNDKGWWYEWQNNSKWMKLGSSPLVPSSDTPAVEGAGATVLIKESKLLRNNNSIDAIVSGTAQGVSGVIVFISAYDYGSVKYETMKGQLGKDGVYQVDSNVSKGTWAVQLPVLSVPRESFNERYFAVVYDASSKKLLGGSMLDVVAGPTQAKSLIELKSPKKGTVYSKSVKGNDIVMQWDAKNVPPNTNVIYEIEAVSSPSTSFITGTKGQVVAKSGITEHRFAINSAGTLDAGEYKVRFLLQQCHSMGCNVSYTTGPLKESLKTYAESGYSYFTVVNRAAATSTAPAAVAPTLTLTSPTTNQSYKIGDTISMVWSNANLSGDVANITLFGNNTERHIIKSVPIRNGQATYTIPASDNLGAIVAGTYDLSIWVTNIKDGDPKGVKSSVNVKISNPSVSPTPLPTPPTQSLSPDGSSITITSGGSLRTQHGVWSFGGTKRSGGQVILLNGVSGSGSAVELHVLQQGRVFVRNALNNWYEWQNNAWFKLAVSPIAPAEPPSGSEGGDGGGGSDGGGASATPSSRVLGASTDANAEITARLEQIIELLKKLK